MFLPADVTQDDATLRDVVHHWRHDGLAFVHKELPQLLVILVIAFVLMRIVSFFANRTKMLADLQAQNNPQRASEIRTLAAILRLTVLRDGDGTLYFVPNSQIATVSNLSRDFSVASLNITVDASADPDQVLRILRATALAVRNDPAFKEVAIADPDVPGVDSISGRVVTYPVTIRVRVNRKDAILRELRRRILQAFEANAIPLGTDPANMLVMHHADPTAPPAQQPLTS